MKQARGVRLAAGPESSVSTGRSSGSYGAMGGSDNGVPYPLYGSEIEPTELGSGGCPPGAAPASSDAAGPPSAAQSPAQYHCEDGRATWSRVLATTVAGKGCCCDGSAPNAAAAGDAGWRRAGA